MVQANEEAIRNTNEKLYVYYDDFNFKCNDKLFRIIADACNSAKTLSIVYWFIKKMGKDNMVEIKSNRYMIDRAKITAATYYKVINTLILCNFMVKLTSKKFMINPDMVLNFRKTKNKDLPELKALYGSYKTTTI